jgi:hypothetical protein
MTTTRPADPYHKRNSNGHWRWMHEPERFRGRYNRFYGMSSDQRSFGDHSLRVDHFVSNGPHGQWRDWMKVRYYFEMLGTQTMQSMNVLLHEIEPILRGADPQQLRKIFELALTRRGSNALQVSHWWNWYRGQCEIDVPIWAHRVACNICGVRFTNGVDGAALSCFYCYESRGICLNCNSSARLTEDEYEEREFTIPQMLGSTDTNGLFCADCATRHHMPSLRHILNYTANPKEHLRYTEPGDDLDPDARGKSNDLRYGIELELETDSTDAEIQRRIASGVVEGLGSKAIAKHDGTINRGFEVCTQPMTLMEHRAFWPDAGQCAAWNKVHSAANVGMHVHSSLYKPVMDGAARRNGFSRDYLMELPKVARYLLFMHNRRTHPYIRRVAGRDGTNYNRYHPEIPYRTFLDIAENRRPMPDGRYSAVHLPNNHPTVETRIFASTTDVWELLARLDLVAAGLAFANTAHIKDMFWPQFWEWARGEGTRFPFLLEYVDKLGLMDRQAPAIQAELAACDRDGHTEKWYWSR